MKYLLTLCLFFPGCFSAARILPDVALPIAPDAGTPFELIAYWGSAFSGLLFFAGIILLWSNPKRGQQALVTAVSLLVGCQIMLWIGAHLAFISVVCLVCGLIYVAYRHKDSVEDLFRDRDESFHKEIEARSERLRLIKTCAEETALVPHGEKPTETIEITRSLAHG